MKCSKCQFENREGVKFCEQCGAKFEMECPNCQAKIPLAIKFCGKCGHNLTIPSEAPPQELSFDEKIDKIQRYLPKGLTEKILAQRGKIEGERKQVTVMFCDMAGFTPLSEVLGAEEAYSIMDQVYEILIHKVHEFEGTVNEMTGDGVMALFGAPIALEDAPQRAIRVAMAIHREMSKFNDKLKQEQSSLPLLKMRIGIHTGPVVVGTLGNDLRVEFKAVGDTVNLASRLEGLAVPGATYITEDTFKLTEGLFRFEALGERVVKGKKDPVRIYRVIATSSRRTRFDVSAERGLTPFVGRERELELLLDGFERSKTGRGQAFSVMAEAGVGKSRLLYEFRKAISNEDITFLEGKCLSYSRGVAYHPVIDILKSTFNILDSDDCFKIREKVEQWLKTIGINEAATLPYLLELLSVKESGIDKIPMSPESRKDRIMSAVNLITLKGSEVRPLIIAVEDLHWIDRSSEEFFKTQLESISGARIFLIFTYRPEYVHTWGGKSYHSQITLNRLSNRESLAMVSHLLGTAEIDSQIEELVLEKTEGVPFFIEEFLKSLKDLRIIEEQKKKYCLVKDIKNVAIPSTIQEVIMTRVDSLPETAKELLQIGSAIEREFSYELIKRVTNFDENELLSRLSVLKDSELLYERGIYPQSTYIFKHALTQEVVYDSILGKRKKHLHEEIAKIIEELYKDNIEEHYEVLSEHFIKAKNYEKSVEYCRLMGKKAAQKASINDAIVYGKKRLACLEKLNQTKDVRKKIIDARTTLGLYFLQMSNFVEAREAVTPVIDQAIKENYKKRVCKINVIEGAYYFAIKEDLPEALNKLKKALKISPEVNDYISVVIAQGELGCAMGLNCEFDEALKHLRDAINIVKTTNSKWAMAIHKNFQTFFIYNFQGKIDLEYKTSKEAVQLAEDSGDILSKAIALTSLGVSCYNKRLLADAEKYLLEGFHYSERINLPVWESIAQAFLGETYYELGDYPKSKTYFINADSQIEKNRLLPSWMNLNKIATVRSMVMNNEKDVDLEAIYNYISENKFKAYEGWIRRYLGEILSSIDEKHLSDAEDWIKKAIEADQRNGMMFFLGKDYALYTEYFKRKDDLPKARENLNKAIDIFKECGADGWVEKYEKELAAM
ncbi:MAG: AAA family ATPase [Desulfobacteraceae bacterium]|nr:AAA family ATPase [Desulfobacteraceae bacterium]MBC2756945.1 AAA family ATPase [Desulfobacteraceae bacterium]